jgi:inosine/xanthosine triphosphatase
LSHSTLPGPETIAIGSRNPAKTLGVRSVLAETFPRTRFLEVETGRAAKSQPVTFPEILHGASRRAEFALAATRAEMAVGVEAGILSSREKRLNVQLAVIMDSHGASSVGSSCGFMLPGSLVRRMLREGNELGRYSREIAGTKEVRETDGIVYHLSGGRTSRLEMTEQCVKMALIPWLNRRLYGL